MSNIRQSDELSVSSSAENMDRVDACERVNILIQDDAESQEAKHAEEIEWTEKYLESNYTLLNVDGDDDDIIKGAVHYVKKYYKPSPNCLLNFLFKRIPFFGWIRKYDVKNNLFKDTIAGLTIGTVHIPSAMAYSLLAGLPPINGLYVTFFIILMYTFFGSSRHLQMGTFSIIALMVNNAVEKGKGTLYPENSIANGTASSNTNFLSNNSEEAKVMIAMCVSFFVGIIQIACGILHFGAATKFLSDAIINGFTCAATYQILVSQLNTLLGLKIGRTDLPLSLIGNLIEIFKVIKNTNPAAVVISAVSMIFLILARTQINERFKKKLPVPIPFELLTVIVATVISYFVGFKERWNVTIVGPMPLGFPSPRIPAYSSISSIIGDAISIAIVSYAINISIAKLYSRKNKYEISPNQEFLAYGLGNFSVSFFGGFPGCVGLARCLIFESVGGKTQLSGFFSSGLVLLVFLFLGPQFKFLPNAVLASIIVSTLLKKLLEVKVFIKIWRKSKIEALGWLITFSGVVIFNVDIGLYMGLGCSLILFIIQTQRPRVTILGNIPGTELYEDIKKFEEAKELEGIKIIRYERSVYYANVDNFKYKIIKLTGVNPFELIERAKNEELKKSKTAQISFSSTTTNRLKSCFPCFKSKMTGEIPESENVGQIDFIQNNTGSEPLRRKYIIENGLKHIILDCSCMNYIDSQGVNTILQLNKAYREVGIKLYLSYCKDSVINAFKKYINKEECDMSCLYVATSDAVKRARTIIQKEKSDSFRSNEPNN